VLSIVQWSGIMREWFQESKKMATMALVFLLLMAWCLAPVSAIAVMGSKYMESIAPGGTDIHTMTVSSGPEPTDIRIDVMGFGQAMDKGYISLDPANDLSPYSGRTFITLSTTTLHLEPGTSQDVKAEIKLPQNVGAGGRYAIISLHALAKPGQSFTTGVNVPVFITVSGSPLNETGSILKVDTGVVTIGQPIAVTTTFKNTGNHHYYGTINDVRLSDSKGNLIANVSTSPSPFAIIPGNTVEYTVRPEVKDLPVGTYTVSSKIILESGRVLDEKTSTFELKESYIPPPTESSITLSPDRPGTLSSSDGRYSVIFPQGAVLGDVVVSLKPYSRDNRHPAPSGAILGATCFEITGLTGLLSKDATVQVTYSADDLAVAGGDASQLKLSYWDTAQGTWVILPTQLTTQNMKLTATTNHLSIWAVLVSPKTTSPVSKTPLPAMLVVASVIVTVIISGGIFRQRK
jgi:hypothetical protein